MRPFLALLILVVFASRAIAQAPSLIETPAKHVSILDYETGRLLYCDGCREPMPPASMSKLMTTLIVAEKLKSGAVRPDQKLLVSERAWRFGAQSDGSHMFLPLGAEVEVRDLLQGVIVASANDACIVLAEGIAGSEAAFAQMMNARAKELGLASAHFTNATGLPDPGHLISSEDLGRLLAFIIREHPDTYALYSRTQMDLADDELEARNSRALNQNRNPLLGRFPGVDGGKTGHTSVSGYGLAVSAKSGEGVRRIVVFNGAKSMAERQAAAESLMRAAFDAFDIVRLFEAGEIVGEAALWLGARESVPLAAKVPIIVSAPRAAFGSLKAEIVYQKPAPAPVKTGDEIAALIISGPGLEEQRFPLLATRNVGRQNVIGRALTGLGIVLGGS